ncbi:MAG: beta strand repeat-containing protein [Gammaproteobacteria bacterium]
MSKLYIFLIASFMIALVGATTPTVYITNTNYLNYTISSGTVSLTQDLVCGNFTLSAGAVLDTNGHNIYCINDVNISGTIYTGTNVYGGGNGIYIQANTFNCNGGTIDSQGNAGNAGVAGNGGNGGGSIIIAYDGTNITGCTTYNENGGSGGTAEGGGSYLNTGGGNGGSTRNAGGIGGTSSPTAGADGTTPTPPVLSNPIIQNIIGIINSYLEGAQGGIGNNIQEKLSASFANSYGGSGGGGGGANTNGAGASGGNGGNGQLITYSFGSAPINIQQNLANLFIGINATSPHLSYIYNPNQSSFTNQTVEFTKSTSLIGDIVGYDIIINSGVTLTTNGYSILAYNNFTCNGGIINTGYSNTGGAGEITGNPGGSFTNSYSGSGGAGGNNALGNEGGSGGATLVPGGAAQNSGVGGQAGATPAAPIVNNSLINSIYDFGAINYLSGAGGGGGSHVTGSYASNGGDGAYGLLLQANNINANTCTINAYGQNGVQGEGGTYGSGGGGGGGGGTLIFTYGNAYSAPSYDNNGGPGGASGGGGGFPGGGGGNGQTFIYKYSLERPVPLQSPPIYYTDPFQIYAVGNPSDILNLSVNNDTNFSVNQSPIIFNVTNSTYLDAMISAGYNTIQVSNSSGISFSINQEIFQATPIMSLVVPNNIIYNGLNQQIFANNTVLENATNSPNVLNFPLYLNNVQVATSPTNGSVDYTQTGSNLSTGTYNYVFNTTGNTNYTTSSLAGTFTITDGYVIPYNLTPTTLWYPAMMSYNITGIDNANDTLTLNLSLINYTSSEIYSNSAYVNDTNVTLNLTNLSAGTYTLYMNLTDALGNSILNTTTFRIAPYLSFINISTPEPNNITYNNLNQSIILNTSVFQYQLPQGISNSYTLTFTNTQNISTSNDFTQLVQVNGLTNNNFINGNASNVEFYYLGNNTIIPSWFGGNSSNDSQTNDFNTSNSLFWYLNLTGGIPANSSVEIGMGFAPMATNLFNLSLGIGEAPQIFCASGCLATTYAEYDDGANVFPNYWNFNSTTLPTGWSTFTENSTATVNNGVTLASQYNYSILQYNQPLVNQTLNTYIYNTVQSNNSYYDIGFFNTTITPNYYVSITANNAQSVSTGDNFQQEITFNPSSYSSYERSDLGNIRFYNGTQVLDSWCESGCTSSSTSAIFWVKLPNGIAANSAVVINMTFFPTSVEYDGVTAGEYPTATGTYGQYDNGYNVFTQYDNFAGTTLNSSWGSTISSGSSITVSNGLTLQGGNGGTGQSSDIYRSVSGANATIYTTEIDGYMYSGSGSGTWTINFANMFVYANTVGLESVPPSTTSFSNTPGYGLYTDNGTLSQQKTLYNGIATNTQAILSLYMSDATVYANINYNNVLSYSINSNSVPSPTNVELFSGAISSGTAPNIFAQWYRIRLTPPNLVMPATTFGSVVPIIAVDNQPITSQYNYSQQNFVGLDSFNQIYNLVSNGATIISSTAQDLSNGIYSVSGQPLYAQENFTDLLASSSPSIVLPNNVINYLNLTITNNQNIATASDFTQNITFDGLDNNTLLNGNASNVEFFYANGTIIPSWFEGNVSNETQNSSFNTSSNLMWWLNLTNGISSDSYVSIHMGFGNMATNFFNNSTTGEAPQLSPIYAEYDDGVNVFPTYYNFAGTTLPSSLNTITLSPGTISVDNGLIANAGGASNNYAYVYTKTTYNPSTYISEALALQNSPRGGWLDSSGYGAGINTGSWVTFSGWDSNGYVTISNASSVPTVEGATYQSGNNIAYNNYIHSYSASASVINPSNVAWGDYFDNAVSTPNIQWIRTRFYPPNGIMPTVSINSQNSVSTNGNLYPTIAIIGDNNSNMSLYSIWSTYTPPNGTMPSQTLSSINPTANVNTTFNLYLNTLLIVSNISLNNQFVYIQNGSNLSVGNYTYTLNTTNSSFTNMTSTASFTIQQANASFQTNPSLPANIISYVPVALNNDLNSITLNSSPLYQNITVDSSVYPLANSDDSNIEWFWENGTIINSTIIANASNTSSSTLWLLNLTSSYTSTINIYMGFGNLTANFTSNLSAVANSLNTNTQFGNQFTPTELYVNNSQTNTSVWTRVPININTTGMFNISGLNWEIYYQYPNGTVSAFSSTASNLRLPFASGATYGNYSWYMNTSGNANYSGDQYSPNIILSVNEVPMSLSWYNLTGFNQTYPNVTGFNVTGTDADNFTNLTLNVSLLNYLGNEVYSNTSYINDTNASNITYTGQIAAGNYTIYFNLSDNFGNYITNSTQINISKGVPTMSLSIPNSYTYNNLNDTIYANNSIWESSSQTPNDLIYNLTLNGITVSNPLANTSSTYNQNGTNLSAGTYTYNFSTNGNANYTANYINNSFTINKATFTPSLLINGSSTSTTTVINKPFYVNSTVSSINNQLPYSIWYFYPNGTLASPAWNISTTDIQNQFTPSAGGNYNFTINTTGNQNYTAVNTGNITVSVISAFVNVMIYDLNGTPVYPNVMFFNITPDYNGTSNLTLNVSLISYTGSEVFSNNVTNLENTTINNSDSTLNYGSLAAGLYTLYVNVSDTYGNYIDNSTTFVIDQATPVLTLTLPNNLIYNNINNTIYANNTVYETSGQSPNNLPFNLTLNGLTVSNPLANTSSTYNQNGTNLSAGTYDYNFSTIGNQNYTSAYVNSSFIISKATPPTPVITVNGSTTSTNTITNQTILIGADISPSINNQLPYSIWYYYPNGTAALFNTIITSGVKYFSVINTPPGAYNFTINTTGNTNYTSLNTGNVTDNVYPAFSSLLYYNLNGTSIYPEVVFWNVTPNYNASNNITLNISLISPTDDEIFSNTIANGINTTINNINSSLVNGSLAVGTYTIYFNASDTLGNYIVNSTTFTINKGTPILALGLPVNLTYNNTPLSILSNSSIWENSQSLPTPNNPVLNLYLNGNLVSNPIVNTSSTYTQNGVDLSAGTYSYVLNTTGNANYTGDAVSGNFTINQANSTLTLDVPINFSYNGIGGNITYGISTINNQSPVYLSYNLTDNEDNLFQFINASNTTSTSANFITDPRSGIFNVSLFAPSSTNYTSQFLGYSIFAITQANGSISLKLNGVNGNTSILEDTAIPINATSSESSLSNPNMSIYLNGTSINQNYANFITVDEQPTTPTVQNYTALVSSNNYTNASQTWFLTVNASNFNATLQPTYEYLFPNQTYNSTGNQIFNLLNYTYNVSYSSYWNLSSITVNFGDGVIDVENITNTSGTATNFFNSFSNNSNTSYNISITLKDIYNNTATFNESLNTTKYIFPQITNPVIIFANIYGGNTPQNYTYVGVKTPIYITQSSGSFPISNITLLFGDGNFSFTEATNSSQIGVNHIYSANGNYIASANASDINGFSTINASNFTVYNYSYGKVTLLPPDLGFTTNQSYVFNFVPGTTAGNYVTIYWGDGTSSVYTFQQNGQGQNFVLYHNYTIPQTYILSAYVTDIAGGNADVLTNPSLTIYKFANPYITSITPNNPSNGATSLALNFTINIQQSYPLQNLTINWNDGYGNVNSTITNLNLSTLSQATNLTDTIYVTHTFPFLQNYTLYTNICDTIGDCEQQIFPIQLSYPLGANQTANNNFENQTNAEANANSPNVQLAQNPAPYIIILVLVLTIMGACAILLLRNRRR